MPFYTLSVAKISTRICRKSYLFHKVLNFSVSSTLETLDFSDESSCSNEYNNSHNQTQSCNSYYTELQQKMREYASSGSCKEALNILSFMGNVVPGKPTVNDYNAVMYYYMKSRGAKLELVYDIYEGMKSFGPSPNASTFNTLFNGFLSYGLVREAFLVAKEMHQSGFVPVSSSLSRLIKKSLEIDHLENSVDTLKFMLGLNYIPTRLTVDSLISCLSRAGSIEGAYFVFSTLSSYGYSHHNSILWALCKCGQTYTALALICSLKKKGVVLSVRSYTALVYGFSREGLWKEAYLVLNTMKYDGCTANIITYTVMAKFLCDSGRVDEAMRILDLIEKEKCDTDLIIYNVILRALCRHDRILEARELMPLLEKNGCSPDRFTYSALVGGLLKAGKVWLAYDILLDILTRGSDVDIVVYNIYLNCLCVINRSEEAFSQMKSAVEKGLIIPNNVTYNTVLKGFCGEQNMDKALEILDHFDWGPNGPDVCSFNTMISAACKLRDLSFIRRILYRMEFEGIKLNVVSSTCMMQYFCAVGKFSDCFKLLEYGPSPNIVSYNVLLHGLCKKGLLGTAYRKFEDLKRDGFSPDTTSYKILMYAAMREENRWLVKELLMDMRSRKLVLDNVTYGPIIYGFCRAGKILDALRLRDQMIVNGIPPTSFINNTILGALFRRGKLQEVILLLKDMLIDGSGPDMVSFDFLKQSNLEGMIKRFPRNMKALDLLMTTLHMVTHQGIYRLKENVDKSSLKLLDPL